MRNSHIATSIVVLAAASVAFALAPFAQAKLKVKANVDKPYIIKSTSASTTELSGMMTQTIKANVSTTQKMTFGATTEGWSKVGIENQEVSFKTDAEMPGMDVAAAEKAMKEMTFEMEVNEKGEIRNYKMVKGSKEDAAMAMMLTQGQDIMSQVGLNGISFPEGDIAVGTKWSKEVDITKMMNDNSMGMMTAKDAKLPMAYEVIAIKTVDGKEVAVIKMTSDATIALELAIPGAEGPGKVRMISDSLFTVDLATGMVTKVTGTMNSTSDLGIITVTSKSTNEMVVSH